MQPPKKLLIINIFGIGDVLFTTPLISNLKLAYPNLSIGYLCNRRTVSVLEKNPKIERTFIYERDEFNEVYRKSKIQYFKKTAEFISVIRRENYDTVIDVSLNSFMSFLSFAAGIPHRVGLDYKNRGIFLNQKIKFAGYEEKHVVDYYLELLELIGVPSRIRNLELPLSEDDHVWVKNFFKQNKLNENCLTIGLVPGGGQSWGEDAIYKRWAPQNYAKLADKIVEKYKAQIILLGGLGDKIVCREVRHQMHQPCVFACGETTIPQFAALAKQCRLNIVNDGGPLHIAVAAKAKTVSIFGPVDERVYGPYPFITDQNQTEHGVVVKDFACRPCYRNFRKAQCQHLSCLEKITVEDVFKKVEEMLERVS